MYKKAKYSFLASGILSLVSVAFSPEAQKFDVVVQHAASQEPRTEKSLYPEHGPVAIFFSADLAAINVSHYSGPPVLLNMYADWCPHCVHLMPEWGRLASAFKGDEGVKIAAINCADTHEVDACDRANVTYFPSIRCYGCPKSDICLASPCTADTGFANGDSEFAGKMSEWLSNATSGKLRPTHPDLLRSHSVHHSVSVAGPPGTSGWVPDYFIAQTSRMDDGMRGLVWALWQRSDRQVTTYVLRFLVRLLDPFNSTTTWNASTLRQLLNKIERPRHGVVTIRTALSEWAQNHSMHNINDPQAFAEFKDGIFASGSSLNGYATCSTVTCALWSALHIITVIPAVLASRGVAKVSSGEVLAFARYLVAELLACKSCSEHFTHAFNVCGFGRCEVGNSTDWEGLALWMWRAHLGVSLRVAAESGTTVDRRWPAFEDCPGCWRTESVLADHRASPVKSVNMSAEVLDAPFNLSNVFRYTVETYLGSDAAKGVSQLYTQRDLWHRTRLRIPKQVRRASGHYDIVLYALCFFFVLSACMSARRSRITPVELLEQAIE